MAAAERKNGKHFYYIIAMFQCLRNFVACSFHGNIPHAIVPIKKAFKMAEYLMEGISLTFQLT